MEYEEVPSREDSFYARQGKSNYQSHGDLLWDKDSNNPIIHSKYRAQDAIVVIVKRGIFL
jgi:hypothetical protein